MGYFGRFLTIFRHFWTIFEEKIFFYPSFPLFYYISYRKFILYKYKEKSGIWDFCVGCGKSGILTWFDLFGRERRRSLYSSCMIISWMP
jgi:hypothetical protein